ncbi:hypothetical protein N7457_008592 [Penicillium paradoxum]|uniref:uncharacterized protein n=1 Tax=Penicillium paradoxum TaxID=176176 RepID=UPI0025485FF1|nr:uncharacterized protein N7457_008592 [Penicillium paradoxum]KAJ5773696.1 hypothetical protein N7457_008592 [Penicillium paradoxum]
MSGAEVIAVVACVAAIVSAYSDGSRMFTAIRKKYHERRRVPDQSTRDLEWSLARGHHDILSQYNQHQQELGRRYEEGDYIAREQMKDIIITLQGALLRHLREAQEQGTTLDLMALQIESEQGRVRTLVILGDLYHRLARPSPVPPPFAMSIDPTYRRVESFDRGYYPHNPDGFLPSPTPEIRYSSASYPTLPHGFIREELCASPTETLGSPREFEAPSPKTRRRSSGLGSVVSSMGDLLHSRSRHGSTPSVASSAPESGFSSHPGGNNPRPPSTPETIPELDVRPATPPRKPKSQSNPIAHDDLWGNPWNQEYDTDSGPDDIITRPEIKEKPNGYLSPISAPLSPPLSTPIQPRHNSLSAPSIASTDSTHSNPSTSSSTEPPNKAVRPLWPPSKANNYLGFCKGAWKVHAGFRGFKIYSEPGTGYYTQRSWLRCAKCAFEGPMAPKTSSRNPQFDDSVRTHKRSGVRYRFEFLAKSHVPCKRSSGTQFTPNTPHGAFCCVFCCAMAQGSTQVYGNLDTFMAHLAETHWKVEGNTLAVLPNTRCVVGRMALDSEYFDVNILPMRLMS